jgi:hypothetical protein
MRAQAERTAATLMLRLDAAFYLKPRSILYGSFVALRMPAVVLSVLIVCACRRLHVVRASPDPAQGPAGFHCVARPNVVSEGLRPGGPRFSRPGGLAFSSRRRKPTGTIQMRCS